MKLHIPTKSDVENAKRLFGPAREVRLEAYAPYSHYLVGAAILTSRGHMYTGLNVEDAAYTGTHAEASALSAMVKGGERFPVAIAIFGGLDGASSEPLTAPPCGMCRQKLKEFASLNDHDIRVLVRNKKGDLRVALLSELLPMSFGPGDIGVDLAKHRR